jgi:hypothetical protein
VQVVAGLLECALGLEPLVLFLRTLNELVGRANRLLRVIARDDRVAFVGCALRKRGGQRVEEGGGCTCVRAQLVDLRLQPFHARQRLRDVGVAALELFGERQQ